MENENKKVVDDQPNDAQLDELLREVAIPADLKMQLLEIPSLNTEVDRDSKELNQDKKARSTQPTHSNFSTSLGHSHRSPSAWLALAIAAGLAGFAAFIVIRGQGSTNAPEIANTETNESRIQLPEHIDDRNDSEKSLIADNRLLTKEEQQLAKLEAQIEAYDAMLLQFEISQLESKLASVTRQSSSDLQSQEVDSMIAALSGQLVIEFGGTKEQAILSMANVIKRYPDSRGAKIAEDFIQTLSN